MFDKIVLPSPRQVEKEVQNMIHNRITADNGFTCDVYFLKQSTEFDNKVIIRYKMNNTAYAVNVSVEYGKSVRETIELIVTNLATDISGHLLASSNLMTQLNSMLYK